MPNCAIKYPTSLKFISGSRSYSVYKDPLTGKIITNGGSETINAAIDMTWQSGQRQYGKLVNHPVTFTSAQVNQLGHIVYRHVYLQSGNDKILQKPSGNTYDKFSSIDLKSLGFKNSTYTLKYKGDNFVFGGSHCLKDVDSAGTISLVAQKFKTRLVLASGSSITVYRKTDGSLVLIGGANSINTSLKLQYSNINSQWTDVPGAISLSSNSGKKFSASGSSSLNLSSLSSSDTVLTFSYTGSESLESCSSKINISYVLKLPTRCSFNDSSTIFMGKKSRTSSFSKTSDLKDISRGSRIVIDPTPTPTPTSTPKPTSTPTPTPTRTSTPTPTPTNTPAPPWSQNYEQQLGLNLASWTNPDLCGYSVCMNTLGNRVVIGCPSGWSGSLKNSQGVVKSFALISNTWQKIGSDIIGERNLDAFGHSVSMNQSGNIIAVGSIKNDGQSGLISGAGAVYIYQFDGIKWNKLGNTIYGTAAEDQCGYSVTLNPSGDRVVVGFNQFDKNGILNSGIARVYGFNTSTQTWNQIGNDISGLNIINQKLGWSVSINSSSDTVAVGQVRNNGIGGVGIATGHAKVFKLTSSGQVQTWNQIGGDLDIDEEQVNLAIGASVSLNSSGTRIAVGAYASTPKDEDAATGYVKIYELSGSSWNLIGNIKGAYAGEAFGYSVSLDSAGNRVAIGSVGSNSESKKDVGSLCVYGYKNNNNWEKIGKSIFGNSSGLGLGSSVFISKDAKRVGVGTLTGGMAVYKLEEAPPVSSTPTPTPTPTKTSTPTPTPTATIAPSATPTPTISNPINQGFSYSVADFSVKLESFDPVSNSWKDLNDASVIYSTVLPNRLLSPSSSMPLTTEQIDPNNVIAGGGSLEFVCSYAGHLNYQPSFSSVRKKVQYVNNFISANLQSCTPSSITEASYTKTYSLSQLSGYSGAWDLPSGSTIIAKNNTIGKTVYNSSYDLTIANYYPNFMKVVLNNTKNALVVYQPCKTKINSQPAGSTLAFYQDFDLDYVHQGRRLEMNIRLNIGNIKN